MFQYTGILSFLFLHSFFYKNTQNLADPEDVLILAHKSLNFLKVWSKSQPQRSYKNDSYKRKRVYACGE